MDVKNNPRSIFSFLRGLQECSSRKIHLHLTNLHEIESYSLEEYTYTYKYLKKKLLNFLLLLPCGYASFGKGFYSTDMWSMEKTKQKQNKTKEQRAKKYLCTSSRFLSVTHRLSKLNRPLPSSKNPHFQNKARCTTFLLKVSFICMRMKNDFHIKGWAPTLVLKQRPGGTRKWPFGVYI